MIRSKRRHRLHIRTGIFPPKVETPQVSLVAKITHRRRPDYLMVRLTEPERRAIEAAVRAAGAGSPSEWIRNVVLPAAADVTARVRLGVIERLVQRARLGEEVA